ncbi:galactonate dehydratase [Paenibacillus cremeus]|uniref:Galactonate dehydratase n=1 Tax=Paenibacillus cremeus TaxID=2163881 RepID=A0A559JW50_9BACL|nr:galactonate dehydratase [Paenibacillus cremeus]TVY04020.1 galactonate dehydratase [Paenibacillus cremeus]
MKITDIKTYLVSTLRQNWLFVKVLTDEGIHGWGEASVEGQEMAVEQSIHVLAKRSVIGDDPRNIEKIWQKMYRHGFWKGGFIYMSAMSAIDQALWDINGKIYNIPVYMLLGGAVRDKIRTYTHASNAESALKAIEMGFDGIKTGGGKSGLIYDPASDIEFLDENLASIRRAIGKDKVICIDSHGQSAPAEAIKLLEVAAKHNVYFYEEPIPPENSAAYKRIRDNSSKVPIATGERLFSRFEFREIVENQLVDIVQPDICHCGGITEIRKIASMVEPYHIRFAPHNPNGPVATAASLHVSAATQNFDILEFAASSVYERADIFNISLKPENGYFPLPEGPGLGIELDEKAFEKYPYIYKQYEPRYKVDGSVAEI